MARVSKKDTNITDESRVRMYLIYGHDMMEQVLKGNWGIGNVMRNAIYCVFNENRYLVNSQNL